MVLTMRNIEPVSQSRGTRKSRVLYLGTENESVLMIDGRRLILFTVELWVCREMTWLFGGDASADSRLKFTDGVGAVFPGTNVHSGSDPVRDAVVCPVVALY